MLARDFRIWTEILFDGALKGGGTEYGGEGALKRVGNWNGGRGRL